MWVCLGGVLPDSTIGLLKFGRCSLGLFTVGVFFRSLILFFMQSTPCWDFVWGHIDGLTNDAWLRILALLARQLVGIASEIQ